MPCGPVAQLDRASVFGTEGWGFDSLRGRHAMIRRFIPFIPPDVLLIIFQQLAAEILLIESGLVNLSESLANPTVKVLHLSL